MFKTKDVQISVVQTVEFLKSDKTDLLKGKVHPPPSLSCIKKKKHFMMSTPARPPARACVRQEPLNNELAMVADTIQRSRSRIVQSPERIKRTISTMSSTVLEERRTVTLHDAKARDLQTKINGVLSAERVGFLII